MTDAVNISSLIARPFWSVHTDIRRKAHSEYWLKGGRGSTKSSFSALEIVLGLMRDPEANAIIYRKVKDTLRTSVYEEIKTATERLGVSGYFSFRLSPLEIIYTPTNQRILFRGADDPGKSKSIKLSQGYFGYLWFEELAEFRSWDDILTIMASIVRGNNKTLTICSYNPPIKAQSWVNKKVLEPEDYRLVHSSTYLDVPHDWLGDDFIAQAEALKRTNERAYRHMYMGEVTGSGGQVFDNLDIRRITQDEIDSIGRTYAGLDFGFAVDPDALTVWGFDSRQRKLWALDEFYGIRNSADRLAEEVKRRCPGQSVRCDSADPRMISELSGRGVKAIGVKKPAGSVDHGTHWLQDLGKIIIDPKRTPNIAREFTSYEYELDRNENFISEYPDRDNHTIDSCRYALEPEIGKRKLGTLDARKLGL